MELFLYDAWLLFMLRTKNSCRKLYLQRCLAVGGVIRSTLSPMHVHLSVSVVFDDHPQRHQNNDVHLCTQSTFFHVILIFHSTVLLHLLEVFGCWNKNLRRSCLLNSKLIALLLIFIRCAFYVYTYLVSRCLSVLHHRHIVAHCFPSECKMTGFGLRFETHAIVVRLWTKFNYAENWWWWWWWCIPSTWTRSASTTSQAANFNFAKHHLPSDIPTIAL